MHSISPEPTTKKPNTYRFAILTDFDSDERQRLIGFEKKSVSFNASSSKCFQDFFDFFSLFFLGGE